jgi:hypothetical protein
MGFNSGFKGLRNTGLGNICNKWPTLSKETSSCLQTPDANFFYDRTKALVSKCDKCLIVIGSYDEIWCVPSATHVSCIYRNQNEVQGIGESETYFFLTHWFLGSRKYRKFPRSANIHTYIHTHIFRFNTETNFPKILFRQIFSSLTFRPLKLIPTHCLSHPVKQSHIPHQWWCRETSHLQCLQQRPAKYIILNNKINDSAKNFFKQSFVLQKSMKFGVPIRVNLHTRWIKPEIQLSMQTVLYTRMPQPSSQTLVEKSWNNKRISYGSGH